MQTRSNVDSPKIRSMVQVSTAPNVEAKYNLSQNPCFALLLDPLKGFEVVLENDLDDIFEFDFTYLMNYHDISMLSQISRVFFFILLMLIFNRHIHNFIISHCLSHTFIFFCRILNFTIRNSINCYFFYAPLFIFQTTTWTSLDFSKFQRASWARFYCRAGSLHLESR